jgi:hypothetical protein
MTRCNRSGFLASRYGGVLPAGASAAEARAGIGYDTSKGDLHG